MRQTKLNNMKKFFIIALFISTIVVFMDPYKRYADSATQFLSENSTEEPIYITEKIIIKHVSNDRYTITFNDKKPCYVPKTNGYNGKVFSSITRKVYMGTYNEKIFC